MAGKPRVQVFLSPELARQGTQHVGYRAKANVRVWDNGHVSEYRLDGPPNAVKTKQEANSIMRPLVFQHLQEKGWEDAEILEVNDPAVDGRPAH